MVGYPVQVVFGDAQVLLQLGVDQVGVAVEQAVIGQLLGYSLGGGGFGDEGFLHLVAQLLKLPVADGFLAHPLDLGVHGSFQLIGIAAHIGHGKVEKQAGLFGFHGHLGIVHDGPLLESLEPPFGGRTFEQATIPLHIVATDLANGEKVVVNSGSVRDAVRASIAIPYVWKPWKIGDRWLLDGCLSDPLPVDVAIREGADVILAMGFESAYPRRIRSATRYAFQVNSIYTNNLLRANYSFHNLAHHAEIIPVLPDFGGPIRLFDTDQFPHVIRQGELATEAQLDYLHRVLEGAGG